MAQLKCTAEKAIIRTKNHLLLPFLLLPPGSEWRKNEEPVGIQLNEE